MKDEYMSYILEQFQKLSEIESPTGYTEKAASYVFGELVHLGYSPTITVKGGVIVDLGGRTDGVLLTAHLETIGAVVARVKPNGGLKISPVGGLVLQNVEAENCKVITRFDGVYSGTLQLNEPSSHVNLGLADQKRTVDTMEVVLDEKTYSREDTLKLGVCNGDFIYFDPRTVITASGYIKSRYLDDKICAALLLGFAKYLKDNKLVPHRKIWAHFTVYEEVGHGACASVPYDVTEVLSVDMACVGGGLDGDECKVSICAKDSGGPYNYDIITKLVQIAREKNLNYAVDVYPSYGSDAEAAVSSGYDIRHGLIGPGVYASHGYERTHKEGIVNTFELLTGYLI